MKKQVFKSFSILAAMALGVASCNLDSPEVSYVGKGIRYSPSAGRSTRAAVTGIANLGNVKVSAYGNGSAYYVGDIISNTGAMVDPVVSRYWPSYALDFYAVSPASTTLSGNTFDYTSLADVASLSEETLTDPMVAYNHAAHEDCNGAVPLDFFHSLAKVRIKAINTGTQFRVRVAAAKLEGFLQSGTFTFPESSSYCAAGARAAQVIDEEVTPATWWAPAAGSEVSYSRANMSGESLVATTLSGTSSDAMMGEYADFYIIPQVSGEKTHWIGILINAEMNNGIGYAQVYPYTDGAFGFVRVNIDEGIEFKAGHTYSIVVDFTKGIGVATKGSGALIKEPIVFPSGEDLEGNPIYIQPSTILDENGNDITPPGGAVDTDPGIVRDPDTGEGVEPDPDKPIIDGSKPITYTIIVTDWQNASIPVAL
ncbi:MAG: fimbrillin family protein [Bacteroidales bacterium]|nr:fimbrillin family protein [Bacteroidales bacterium]